jgi:hypothetical protein
MVELQATVLATALVVRLLRDAEAPADFPTDSLCPRRTRDTCNAWMFASADLPFRAKSMSPFESLEIAGLEP